MVCAAQTKFYNSLFIVDDMKEYVYTSGGSNG